VTGKEIKISYVSSRSDILAAYLFTWRRSTRMKLMQLFIATATCVYVLLYGGSIPMLAGIILLEAAFLLLFPQIMFKSDRRTLTITPLGISTRIGGRSGEVSWRKIVIIGKEGERIFLVNQTLNSFAIPLRAFSSPSERDEFLKFARIWHRDHNFGSDRS
jgi:hypothetical protein